MIDSVLKGTGNSRFLKSAVPAGTSWADALAMLQAGTFPIDFNGINTEGFQQVGTPLNKANLLKDATAAQIGLPPSTTPDGMFQALGNTGELHVWRKTVVTTEEQPAGFTLGDVQTNVSIGVSVSSGAKLSRSRNINVNDAGVVTLESGAGSWETDDSITTLNVSEYYIALSGKPTQSAIQVGDVYYVPSGGAIVKNGSTLYLTSAQKVNAHGIIPAGTTTTYPVSTNPKAYQEGDDAKAAGYVVGEVVTGDFILGQANAADAYLFYKTSSPTVSDDGTIEFDKNQYIKIGYAENWTASTLQAAIRGQFLQRGNYMNPPSNHVPAGTIYIPNDAVVTRSNDNYIVSKYQPVTGYPAIPAGTTIEYLGKLGDKARVQVVSYVGTGTYGKSNPISLTFDFAPKYVRQIGYKSASAVISEGVQNFNYGIPIDLLSESFTPYVGFGDSSYSYGKKSHDEKTITWYNERNSGSNMNISGATYYVIAFT